jgi:DNA-binding transcriptional LysR family regulator
MSPAMLLETGMELRQLRNFLIIGEEGSITAAARILRITQPALSRQIKSLEDDLGTSLLERGAHSVTLTPAGEALMAEGKKLVKAADAMIEKVKLAGIGEPLRIGYAPSLAGDFLAIAIERFTQFHPRVRVSLNDCSSSEMRAGLSSGKLDLILAPPSQVQEIHWENLRTYGWRLVMKAAHPLASKKKITNADLSGEKLLLYDREHYPEYWERITGFFKDNKLQAKIGGEFDGISSLLAALEAGMGVALLSDSIPINRGTREPLVGIPLSTEPGKIVVAAGVAADQPCRPSVLAFIEELKRAAKGK